jgi:single-stranded-DNA-specific exonuclease
MAAGLSLHPDRIPEFRRAISRTVEAATSQLDRTPSLDIDSYLALREISPDLLNRLGKLAPFGPGNPSLTFATRRLALKSHRQIGRSGDHVRLTVEDEGGMVQDVVWWRADLDSLPPGRFDLAYALRVNAFQDRRGVQLEFVDARAVEEEPLEFIHRRQVAVVDYRNLRYADQLRAVQMPGAGIPVWNEGSPIPDLRNARRDQLLPAPTLAIWTAPPGAAELRTALETVNPSTVHLFAVESTPDTTQALIKHLAGLLKHVVNARNGVTTVSALAAALGHRASTVRAGLAWIEAEGDLGISYDGDSLRVRPGGTPRGDRKRMSVELESLLQETAAYRAYFRRAEAEILLTV